jgi:hypothetical protein
VFCVSEQHDDLLMWSHYCKKHTGVVVRLHQHTGLDSVLLSALPVTYAEAPPILSTLENFLCRLTGREHQPVGNEFLLTKASCWSYEREWRAVIPAVDPDTDHRKVALDPTEIGAVYLGCRCSDEDRQEILDLADQHLPATEVWQAEMDPRQFALTFRQLT